MVGNFGEPHIENIPEGTVGVLADLDLFAWITITSPFSTCRLYKDRSLLAGYHALLLWQMARDLLHAMTHRHDDTAGPLTNNLAGLVGQVDTMHLEFHLSVTKGLCQAWSWTARDNFRHRNYCPHSALKVLCKYYPEVLQNPATWQGPSFVSEEPVGPSFVTEEPLCLWQS